MKDCLFGTMDEFIETGYAPSNRATCRGCRTRIEKDTVRLGECTVSDHFNGRLWFHLDCFKLKPLFSTIDPKKQVFKLEQLDEKDRKEVVRKIEQEVERLGGGKSKGSARRGRPAKKKEEEKKEKEKEEESDKEDAKVGRAKSASRNKRVTRSNSRPKSIKNSEPSPKKAKNKRTASQSTKGSAKKKKKEKKKEESGYTQEQQAKFKQLVVKYSKMSTDRLKEILSANNQTKTGTKGDLAEKCADGELLGRIPMCPECGGGKLRFRWQTGIYSCPGFMDDDEFRNCHKIYTMKDVSREPWVLP